MTLMFTVSPFFSADNIGFIGSISAMISVDLPSENIIIQDPPNGLYKAKWTGTEWIEGLEQSKLDEIEYQQYLDSLKPSEDEVKKAQMELLVMNLLIEMEVM